MWSQLRIFGSLTSIKKLIIQIIATPNQLNNILLQLMYTKKCITPSSKSTSIYEEIVLFFLSEFVFRRGYRLN